MYSVHDHGYIQLAEESLPSYATALEEPPTFESRPSISTIHAPFLPSRPTFTVGKKSTPALVAPHDIRAHLTLLRAFAALKERVHDQKHLGSSRYSLTPSVVWEWFLIKSVWRFEFWLKNVIRSTQSVSSDYPGWMPEEVPPIDVLLVWYAYIQNPRTYYEDCNRMHPGLLSRGSFPIYAAELMVNQLDDSYPCSISESQVQQWEQKTGQPWVAPISPSDDPNTTIELICPNCVHLATAPWFNEEQTGWSQKRFATVCSHCGFNITREGMCVFKFARDLKRVVETRRRNTLATVCLDEFTGKVSVSHNALYHKNLIRDLKIEAFEPSASTFASKQLRWSLKQVERRCRVGFRGIENVERMEREGLKDGPLTGLQDIMAAYSVPGPYSINLVDAVETQMLFIEDVASLGWLADTKFDDESKEDFLTLKRSVSQYHAFLNLMYYYGDKYLVPTLSIDVAWHTHILSFSSYRDTSFALLGLLPEHDNDVEHETFAAAFEETSTLWIKAYDIPYTICGCPAGGKLPISGKISTGLSKILGGKGKAKAKASEVGLINPRPDLLSAADAAETHPSDFTCVTVSNYPPAANARTAREKTASKRLLEDREAVNSGTASGWQDLIVKTRQDNGAHTHAFFSCRREIDFKALTPRTNVAGIGQSGKRAPGNRKRREDPVRDLGGKGSVNSAFM